MIFCALTKFVEHLIYSLIYRDGQADERNIEWSLRAFVSEQCVYFCEHEQCIICKFSASWNLSLLKRCFAPSNLADTFNTGQQAQS